jgi:molybdopterin converting factor small subunit
MAGNVIRAKVAVLGSKVQDFVSEGPSTVEHALRAFSNVLPSSADTRLNGKSIPSLSTPLTDGDIIAVVPKIAGG